MRRHGYLFEQIVSFENLIDSAKKAFRGKKDQAVVAAYYFNLENEVIKLRHELIAETYFPKDYRVFEVREPKVRKICSSEFRDRVVHHAICSVIEVIFEKRFIYDTYACRRNKGSHIALSRCQKFSRKSKYFLKCDIQKYFESIDHETLKVLLRHIIKDQKVLNLLDRIINHAVPGSLVGKGLPIGNLTSQYFANLYLGELDHYLKVRLKIKGYLRYMDDFICFANDKNELNDVLKKIRTFTKNILKVELKEKVTLIAPVTLGVPFLGFRIFPNLIRMQRPNLIRYRRKLKAKEAMFKMGNIEQAKFVASVNSMLAHISQANTMKLRRKENVANRLTI